MEKSVKCFIVVLMAVLLSVGQLQITIAQRGCNPVQISWCLQAIVSKMDPSPDCCRRLKSQEGCLCREENDPTFGGYLRLEGAQMVANKCGVTLPRCY